MASFDTISRMFQDLLDALDDELSSRTLGLEQRILGDSETVAGLESRVAALETGIATPVPGIASFIAGNATGTTVAPISAMLLTGGATLAFVTVDDVVVPAHDDVGWDTPANWVASGIDTSTYATHTLRCYAKVGTTVSAASTQVVVTSATAAAILHDSATDNWSTAPNYGFEQWRTSNYLAAGDTIDDVMTRSVLAANAEPGLGKCLRAMIQPYCNDQFIGPTQNLNYWAGKAANEANSIFVRSVFQLGSNAIPFLFQEDIAPQGFCTSQVGRGFEIKLIDIGPGIGTSRVIIKLRGNSGNGATLSVYLTGNTPNGEYRYVYPTGNPVLSDVRYDVQIGLTYNLDGTQTVRAWIGGAAENSPNFTWNTGVGEIWFLSSVWKALANMPFEFGYLNNCFNTQQPIHYERMAVHHSFIT